MGFFDRNKKVKKTAPQPAAVPPPQPPRPRNERTAAPSRYQSRPLPPLPRESPHTLYANGAYHSQPSFHPAGLLPPPPGWAGAGQPPPSYEQSRAYAPIIVNQHYYLAAPSSVQHLPRPHVSSGPLAKTTVKTVVNPVDGHCYGPSLLKIDNSLALLQDCHAQVLCQNGALYEQISNHFNDVMTKIDRDRCHGNERELFVHHEPAATEAPRGTQAHASSKDAPKKSKKHHSKDQPRAQTTAVAASVFSGHYFAKVELYANSRLPMNLPPLKLYVPTYPLLCLAAQYSNRVYQKPKGTERDTYIDADWRSGTKAMCIKSVPMDDMNTIVFAIRGTASFMDWAVNLDTAPTSPAGFLDDPGNFCHAGFLSVAQKMASPVASRLRQLLEEDPARSAYSLLITGHSAGGAIASLLYCHMLSTSQSVQSELTALTGCFRRIHCVTFGTPPVSLLPLAKPTDFECRPQLRKSLFLSFINEGDPVARADKAYVKSLLDLLTAPVPPAAGGSGGSENHHGRGESGAEHSGRSSPKEKKSRTSLAGAKSGKPAKTSAKSAATSPGVSSNHAPKPVWPVPPCTLSTPGRIVVLRSGDARARLRGKKTVEERLNEGVVAHVATDEQLRGVVWGDPVAHVMKLYSGRIETMAIGAVTAKGY